jgi:pyrophosphatase PpaX
LQPFHCVLFDLDGTLIDTNELILTSFQHTLADRLGLHVEPRELYRYFGEPLDYTMRRYAPDRWEELVAHYRAFMLAEHDRLIRPIPGIRELLERLRAAGVRRAVVTSKHSELARLGAQRCGLDGLLEDFVGREMTERHKPDPAPVQLALKRLGLPPGPAVLMVGDSPFDILSGRAAGVRTCAVGWAVHDRSEVAGALPDFYAETVEGLEAICLHEGVSEHRKGTA